MTHIIEQINNLLVAANGRRRERILTQEMVAQVLREALSHGIGYTSGGTVANAYKYRAYTSVCAAVSNGPDYIALKVAEIDAHASLVTWFGPARNNALSIERWMERQTLYTLVDNHWLLMSRREAKRYISSVGRSAVPAGYRAPDVEVTLADSLAAGNCRPTSERVASWFRSTSVPAPVLVKKVIAKEPSLIPFVIRAVVVAERRSKGLS